MAAPATSRRALPWVLGVVVLAFSLVATGRLVGTADAQPPADPKAPRKPDAGPGGLTILGTVDAAQGVVRVDPPAVAGAFAVKELLVDEGKVVAVGDPLVQLDDEVFQKALAEAKAALDEARWTRFKADYARGYEQPQLLRKQKLAVEAARYQWEKAIEARDRGAEVFERLLKTERTTSGDPLSDEEKLRRRRENLELLKADTAIELAKKNLEKEEIDQERLTAALTAADKAGAPADADPQIAAAAVKRYEAKVAQAKAMVDACRVTAKVAGTVEQVEAKPGMLYNPGTRLPLMQIVPSGERIVRAEVDAEFVSRVTDKKDQKVKITDSHHFGHTYEGVVTRIGTSLLPKRGAGDLLAGPPAKVLECRIRILDPAPPGKPPLVVGQPVRVVFGQ